MPNVVRFALDSARYLHVSGVGDFRDGILDIDADNIAAIGRARFLVQPYRAVELGIVDSEEPYPSLPAPPAPPMPDPYAQYLLPSELGPAMATVAQGDNEFTDAQRAAFGTWLDEEGGAGGDLTDVGYDIFPFLGQSNQLGTNAGGDARTDPNDPRVFVYEPSGTYADKIVVAQEPITHAGGATGVGPGLPFARWYAGSTGRPVLLVPMAVGGTALLPGSGTTWNPDVRGSLYDNAVAQTQQALAAAGPNSRVVAVLWLQGETDAGSEPTEAVYAATLDKLIGRLRSDLDDTELPFIVGGMVPEWVAANAGAAAIAAAHAATPTRVRYTAFAPGVAGANNGGADSIHYNAAGAREMGRRKAAALPAARANTSAPAAPVPPPVVPGTTDVGPALTGSPTYGPGKFGTARASGLLVTSAGLTGIRTLEAWVKTTGTAVQVAAGVDTPNLWIGSNAGNSFFGFPAGGNFPGPFIGDGQWHHLALTIHPTAGTAAWVDGAVAVAANGAGTAAATVSGGLGVGGWSNAEYPWDGTVDEVRVSSVVRYTAPFTPPTGPFTADGDTLALYHLNG